MIYTPIMIEISASIKLDEREIQLDFVRSSGPGGQNVNKVSTSVQLRFNVLNSGSLEADVKERLIKLAGKRMTADGDLIIEGKRFRTQDANRQDAMNRLVALIQRAAILPKSRRTTRPSGASRARRLREKRQKSQLKQLRKMDPGEWE